MRRIRLVGQLAEPIGPFTDGVEAGGFLYVSGMLPFDANGDLVGAGDVARQTEQVLDNVCDVLRAAGATFDDVVRVGVYLLTGRPAGVNTVRPAPAMPGRGTLGPALAIMNGHTGCRACSHTTFEYLPESQFPGDEHPLHL